MAVVGKEGTKYRENGRKKFRKREKVRKEETRKQMIRMDENVFTGPSTVIGYEQTRKTGRCLHFITTYNERTRLLYT
jgi:hypothetical protein